MQVSFNASVFRDPSGNMVQTGAPQAALLDVMLPGPSGLDILERIKGSHPQVGVVVASSVEFEAIGENALKMGAFDYLLKPYRLEHLEKVVWQLLDSPR